MSEQTIKIRNTIKNSLKKSVLFKGTFFGLAGTSMLLFAGIFAPQAILGFWGMPLLVFSGGLIAFGLLPYKNLCRLEKFPNELIISEKSLYYIVDRKQAFSVPRISIAKMFYTEQKGLYGIGILLKHPLPEKIIINNPWFDMGKFQKDAKKNHQCDLFVPYFSKRGLEEIQ